jgi:hypothetical protein
MAMLRPLVNGCSGIAVAIFAAGAIQAAGIEYDREPINYSTAEPENSVSALWQNVESGEADFQYDEEFGWLPSLLRELDLPESSQTLVFSKTSMQRSRISPWRPRALYFNDEVYVGYCQGGEVIEISASDPKLGTVFYTIDQQEKSRPELTRQGDSCLICHASAHNQGFPSHLLRSIYSDPSGNPILSMGTHRVNQTTPLKDRWGGWYVTGTHGEQSHLGNLVIRGRKQPHEVENPDGLNVTDLTERFTTSAYLTPHSDIVALMVLEHQTEMHNLITQLNFQTQLALAQEAVLKEALNEPAEPHFDSTMRRIASSGDDLLEYMLFCDEVRLTDPLKGTSSFTEEFASRGPFDGKRRSLRDFDLKRRIFKYPCSYLIYSEAFDAIPDAGREYVLQRLWDVLTGKETDAKFSHLSKADRRAILEILRETKPNLPEYWKSDPSLTEKETGNVTGE